MEAPNICEVARQWHRNTDSSERYQVPTPSDPAEWNIRSVSVAKLFVCGIIDFSIDMCLFLQQFPNDVYNWLAVCSQQYKDPLML